MTSVHMEIVPPAMTTKFVCNHRFYTTIHKTIHTTRLNMLNYVIHLLNDTVFFLTPVHVFAKSSRMKSGHCKNEFAPFSLVTFLATW